MLPIRYGSPAARASSRGRRAAARPPATVPWNCRRVIMVSSPLSYALALGLAEEPAWSEEQQEEQQHERENVLELRSDQAAAQRLENAQQQAAGDASEGVAEAARHRRRETLEAEHRSRVVDGERHRRDDDPRHGA